MQFIQQHGSKFSLLSFLCVTTDKNSLPKPCSLARLCIWLSSECLLTDKTLSSISSNVEVLQGAPLRAPKNKGILLLNQSHRDSSVHENFLSAGTT